MDFQTPEGFTVDQERLAVLQRAQHLAATYGHTLDEALRLIERMAAGAVVAAGFPVDPLCASLHAAALAFQAQHAGMAYMDAVGAVVAQEHGMPVSATLRLRATSPVQVELRAGVDTSAATFSGVAYSGGVVPNYGFAGDMAIDLATLAAPGRVPVLMNHDPDQVVGHASVTNYGRMLDLRDGRFSSATEAGRIVSETRAEGQPWALSVGLNGRFESTDRARGLQLNGRVLNVDTIVRAARLLEVSFVPAGADPEARVS
jgi:hypothetical protein